MFGKTTVALRVLAVLTALTLPSVALAQNSTMQLEIDGLWFLPTGTLQTGESIDAADKFGSGPGLGVTASARVFNQLHLAVRWDWMKSSKDGAFSGFADPAGDILIGTPDGERQILTVNPFLALLQYRWSLNSSLGLFGEGGGGISDFRQKVTVLSGSTPLLTSAGRQRGPVFSLGAGASWALSNDFEVVGRLAYLQALGRDGEVFGKDDSPKFLSGSLGIRLR